MPDDLRFRFSIRIEQEQETHGAVDFYDGTDALHGFAKSFLLVSHYYVNGKVAFQAPSAKGVGINMLPARRGSFDQIVELVVANPELSIFRWGQLAQALR